MKEIHFRAALFVVAALSMTWGYRLLLFDHAPGVFNGVMEDLSYGWYALREPEDLAASGK